MTRVFDIEKTPKNIYRIHRSRCLGSNRRSAATTALRGAHIGNTGTCLCKWMSKALQVGLSALERGQYGWPEFVRLRAGSVWMVIMLGILSPLVRSSHAQPRAAPSNDEEAYHGRNSPMAGMAPEWKFSLGRLYVQNSNSKFKFQVQCFSFKCKFQVSCSSFKSQVSF